MRRAEPLEPDMVAALAAIDATLEGEPVDPEHADLAELALILRAERSEPDPSTAVALDERVAAFPQRVARRRRPWLRRPAWSWLAAPVAALAAVALVAIVVAAGGGGGSSSSFSSSSATDASTSSSAGAASSAAGGAATLGAIAPYAGHGPSRTAPAPSGQGTRQVVQSAQLSLSAAPARVDDVAQQVFDVVDAEQGVVSDSHVTSTGGPDAGARFDLSVPVGNLQRTVSALSQLHDARVVSRSDDTSDITGQVGGAGRRLAETRALRRSLLRQLAAATTSEAIASLRAQLRDADAAIARASANLNGLHRQVQFSRLTVTVQASAVPLTRSPGSGFTLHRALHDAGRVLVVAAGAALIALAVVVPLGLVAGILGWAMMTLRRRRRDAMLDLM
jgi:negative regulator of sigma E activity